MKSIFITGLILVLTTHLVGPLLVSGWFFAQQSSLAEKYCENLDRPQLNCDGQCFLAKKLAAYYAADPGPVEPEPVPTFLPLGWPEAPIQLQGLSARKVYAWQQFLAWPSPLAARIFHPPRA